MMQASRTNCLLPYAAVTAILLMALAVALPAAGKTVAGTDFQSGTTEGWTGLGVRAPGLRVVSTGSIGGSGDLYLRFTDRASTGGVPGLSLLGPPSLRGDYTGVAQRCGALELDVRVFDDQSGQLAFRILLERDADGFQQGAAPEVRAAFRLDQPIDESSGWVHVVAPLRLLDADDNLPSNASGAWEMTSGHPKSAWNALLARVDHLNLPFEINNGTFEEIGIDNVRLTVGECPCPAELPTVTRHAGLADDFALPEERTEPRRELVSRFPNAPFKSFDDPQADHFIAHTFDQLPAGIVRAELEIRMEPVSFLSDNDSLNLVLRPVGSEGTFAYGTRISALPEAGGSWRSGDPPVTFRLDLADLPGGGNVMPQLTAERRLDVLVQDDTTIDYARLHLWRCPLPTVVDGFGFDPLPATTALPNLAGGVEFTPTESGGGFGAEIPDLGGAQGICIALGGHCVGGEGELSHLAATGTTDGTTDSYTTGTLSFAEVGTDVQVSVDYQPDLPVIVKVARTDPADPGDPEKDQILGERFLGLVDAPVAQLTGTACVEEFDSLGFCFRVWLTDPVPVTILPAGPTITGDVLYVCHDIPVGEGFTTGPRAPRLTSFTLEAEGGDGPLEVTGTKVLQLGLLSRALGTARLEPFADGLVVSGIGASGEDGVAFDLTDAQSARVRWSPIGVLEEPPVGAMVEVASEGNLGGVPDQPLGSLRVSKVAAAGLGYEIAADFDEVDAAGQRVQVLRDGEVVADLPGVPGVVGRAGTWPTGLGKLNLPDRTKCFVSEWPAGTLFSIDGSSVRGDELRVLLEGVSEEIGSLSKLAVTAAEIPELAVVDAEASENFPPGACNASDTALCLNDERFRVEVAWKDFQGGSGVGTAVPLTSDTGYFWFFDEANVELVVKVIDGRPVNGNWWVFYGALSNVEYTLTVIDTETGESKQYANPPGTFASRGDTSAFPGGAAAAASRATGPWPSPRVGDLSAFEAADVPVEAMEQTSCTASGTALCLNDERFRVEVAWKDFQGGSGVGTAVPLTSDTGYFWFFDDANVELVVKVLDGRSINGHWWVFYGALSNVEYTLTVTDTKTGESQQYVNPSGTFASRGDTGALPSVED